MIVRQMRTEPSVTAALNAQVHTSRPVRCRAGRLWFLSGDGDRRTALGGTAAASARPARAREVGRMCCTGRGPKTNCWYFPWPGKVARCWSRAGTGPSASSTGRSTSTLGTMELARNNFPD